MIIPRGEEMKRVIILDLDMKILYDGKNKDVIEEIKEEKERILMLALKENEVNIYYYEEEEYPIISITLTPTAIPDLDELYDMLSRVLGNKALMLLTFALSLLSNLRVSS